jgi:hypothetical protein
MPSWVDRDMLMRYRGGGIGHAFQRIPRNQGDVDDMDVDYDPESGDSDEETWQGEEDMEVDSEAEGELLFAEFERQRLTSHWAISTEEQR